MQPGHGRAPFDRVLQVQLLGWDAEGCIPMARKYYCWGKQIGWKLKRDQPDVVEVLRRRGTPFL